MLQGLGRQLDLTALLAPSPGLYFVCSGRQAVIQPFSRRTAQTDFSLDAVCKRSMAGRSGVF